MIKNITVVRKGLVVEVGRLEKSQVKGWVTMYSKKDDFIGGFSLLDTKLKVISKHKVKDTIYITYSIRDKEGRLNNEY